MSWPTTPTLPSPSERPARGCPAPSSSCRSRHSGLAGCAGAAQVGRDHRVRLGELGDQRPPHVAGLGVAVQQQHRIALRRRSDSAATPLTSAKRLSTAMGIGWSLWIFAAGRSAWRVAWVPDIVPEARLRRDAGMTLHFLITRRALTAGGAAARSTRPLRDRQRASRAEAGVGGGLAAGGCLAGERAGGWHPIRADDLLHGAGK